MAVTPTKMGAIVVMFGLASFVAGILAEQWKPSSGTPISGNEAVTCLYPGDRTVLVGYVASGSVGATTFFGMISLFYPYKGKKVPGHLLFRSGIFHVFFNIAFLTSGLAVALLMWPTLTEHYHTLYNVHYNLQNDCPTAKTGLFGGGAFMGLNASLLWLVALILGDNARVDYLEDAEKNAAGEYGPIVAAEP